MYIYVYIFIYIYIYIYISLLPLLPFLYYCNSRYWKNNRGIESSEKELHGNKYIIYII